jgi:hypothetical protein
MTADIIEGVFSFRPRPPAFTKDEEMAVSAALHIFGQAKLWARVQRQLTESTGRTPERETLSKALEALAVIKNQTRC